MKELLENLLKPCLKCSKQPKVFFEALFVSIHCEDCRDEFVCAVGDDAFEQLAPYWNKGSRQISAMGCFNEKLEELKNNESLSTKESCIFWWKALSYTERVNLPEKVTQLLKKLVEESSNTFSCKGSKQ